MTVDGGINPKVQGPVIRGRGYVVSDDFSKFVRLGFRRMGRRGRGRVLGVISEKGCKRSVKETEVWLGPRRGTPVTYHTVRGRPLTLIGRKVSADNRSTTDLLLFWM